MRFSPGCGCCCVDLVVDDDNESKWERVDDSGGTTTVTILTPVDLCNFSLNIKGEQVGDTSFPWAAFSGSLRIYFLEDPDDDSVDAIGEFEITTENAWNSSSVRTASLPYFEPSKVWDSGFGFTGEKDNIGQRSIGTGTFECSAMGLNQSFNQHGWFFEDTNGLTMYSYYDRVVVTGSNLAGAGNTDEPVFEESSSTDLADVDNLGQYLVFLRGSCTAQNIYLRYEVDGDLSQPTTMFTLKTLNEVGDRSCRTDSEYYTEPAEEGNCTTPPLLCDAFRSQKPTYCTAHLVMDITTGDPPVSYASSTDKTVWLRTARPITAGQAWTDLTANEICVAGHQPQYTAATGGTGDGLEWWIRVVLTCDNGTVVATFYIDIFQGGTSGSARLQAYWEVEVAPSVTEPNQIPEVTLTESNATYWNDFSLDYDFTLTINEV